MLGRCVSGGSNDDISSFSTLPKVKNLLKYCIYLYANLIGAKKGSNAIKYQPKKTNKNK